MFLRIRPVTQTNTLVGIKGACAYSGMKIVLSFRLSFFAMKARVNKSYIRKIHKQHSINYEKYVRG